MGKNKGKGPQEPSYKGPQGPSSKEEDPYPTFDRVGTQQDGYGSPESPYTTDIITVAVGSSNKTYFFVHTGVLEHYPDLRTAIGTGQLCYLADTHAETFELVMRFLYTGEYQHSSSSTIPNLLQVSDDATLLHVHALVYCFASTYNLFDLFDLAIENICNLEPLPFSVVLTVAKKMYARLEENDQWFRGFFKSHMRMAIARYPELIKSEGIIRVFRKGVGSLSEDLYTSLTGAIEVTPSRDHYDAEDSAAVNEAEGLAALNEALDRVALNNKGPSSQTANGMAANHMEAHGMSATGQFPNVKVRKVGKTPDDKVPYGMASNHQSSYGITMDDKLPNSKAPDYKAVYGMAPSDNVAYGMASHDTGMAANNQDSDSNLAYGMASYGTDMASNGTSMVANGKTPTISGASCSIHNSQPNMSANDNVAYGMSSYGTPSYGTSMVANGKTPTDTEVRETANESASMSESALKTLEALTKTDEEIEQHNREMQAFKYARDREELLARSPKSYVYYMESVGWLWEWKDGVSLAREFEKITCGGRYSYL